MEDALIIAEMEQHSRDFIEKPNPAFHDMPVCPFARKVRSQNQIKYVIMSLHENVLAEVQAWWHAKQYELLQVIHPSKDLPWNAYEMIVRDLEGKIPQDTVLFSGHPHDDYSVGGVYVRRDPFPNIQVVGREHLLKSREILKSTKYYDLTDENILAYNTWNLTSPSGSNASMTKNKD